MITRVQAHHALSQYPEQADFWRAEIARNPEPTTITRDWLGQQPQLPVDRCSARLHDQGLPAESRITRGDADLQTVVHLAVLAVVAARATDSETVWVQAVSARGVLPIAVTVDGATTVRALLSQIRSTYLQALQSCDVPVSAIFDEAGLTASDLLLVTAAQDSAPEGDSILRLQVDPTGGQLELRYRSDLFTDVTAARLLGAYARVHAALVADVERPLAALLAADDDDLTQLNGFNDTAYDHPSDLELHRFLERQAALTPDRVAIVDDGISFDQLNRHANRIAHRLVQTSVRPGTVVGVCLPRSVQSLTAMYGVLKAGGAYLPIDPTLPAARIAYLIEHSGATTVIGDDAARDLAGPGVDFLNVADPVTAGQPQHNPDVAVGPDDVAYVIYTSGSTGRPKGVMIEHRAIVNRLLWMQRRFPLGPDDVILHKTPISFDVSVWEIFWWSIAGCAVAVLPSGSEKNPERVAERVAAAGVTTMHFVPSMLEAFLQYLSATGTQDGLHTLRRVIASGEALTPLQVSLSRQILPGASLNNLYGPTEAAVDVSWFDCAAADVRRSIPIGAPIDNIRLHVLTRTNATAPIGTPGELCIAGVGLARGYLNAPELTAERFVTHPEIPGERVYRTGDLARWLPDGTIEYLGRIDNQVKIRGYRIELGEIEHVAQLDPAVMECAVAAVQDDSGDRVLCAYLVVAGEYQETRLLALLREQLPPYMVPQFLMLVPEIPTSHNGKRDLRQLPRPDRNRAGHEHVAARTEIEKTLVTIWEETLGHSGVGVTDDFFSLGGDSIKFIRVLAGARAAGLAFSFQDLFAHPVIAELAGVVTTTDGTTGPATAAPFALLEPEDRKRLPAGIVDAYPLSALQQGLLFEMLRRAETGLYHDVATYHVAETIDLTAFRAALSQIVAHHPVMRTSFHVEGFSRPLQLVHRDVPAPLTVVDLSDAGEAEQNAALDRLHAGELAQGFEPGATDLVRVHVHLLGERGSWYTLSYHAALLDGWSVGTLNRDLFASYLTIRDGDRPELASQPVSYPDFLKLEQAAQQSSEQRQFWSEHLNGAQACPIPTAEEPPADAVAGVIFHDVPVSTQVSDGIRSLAERLRVPVKSVLMAAHLAVLGLVSGTDDVITGYEHSGRPEELGGENVVAQFLNTIPLRLPELTGSWSELIRSVYRTELNLLPYRRYPIADIIRLREGRQTPFEAVFNFTHFHVLKDLSDGRGFDLVRSRITSRTEFPFRAEFWQDALNDDVGLALHYDPRRFHPDQMSRIAGYYGRALQALVHDPDTDHRAVSLLGEQELHRLTGELPGRTRELPDGTVLDAVATTVHHRPDAVAVHAGSAHLTYRELDQASKAVAGILHRAGVGRGDVVAVAMDRGLVWAVSVLAVLRRGAIYLPLDVSGPPARVASMVETSGSRYVLTTADPSDPAVSAVPAEVICVHADDFTSDEPHGPDETVGADDPAYVIFTSGSTGTPKGALIHHRGMLNHLIAKVDDLDLSQNDHVAQIAGQTFDISVWQLLAAWLTGGRTVIIGNEIIADPATFLAHVAAERITVLEVVPSYLDALLTELDARPLELPALRWAMVTGEALPPRLTGRWFARFTVPLINAYGPTEASDDVTHHFLTEPVHADRTPVGRAIANTGVYVLRAGGGFAPIGTYGQIWVTGTGVGLGYVNDAERTAAAFMANTIDERSRWMYRTGDVGRWLPAGVLDCAGRDDQQVKIRGHRIELSEIEVALTRLAGIDQAVVVLAGKGANARLIAHLSGAQPMELHAVRTGLAEFLPPQMLPDALVYRSAFPLTRNGKVDRSALAAETVEELIRPVVQPPATERERVAVDAFATVLDLPADAIGVHDNFFDLGGHSLAAMRVSTLLGIGVRDLLIRPTAHLLAELPARRVTGRALLMDLAPGDPAAGEPVTLVCVPFAGGGAVSYLPLARALQEHAPALRVLGVDLPARHSGDRREPVPAAQLVADLADEIASRVRGPVALLGHSAGAPVAVATAERLNRAGIAVRHLFLIGAVLGQAGPQQADSRSDAEIRAYLAGITRLDGLDGLPEQGWADLAAAFRYDAGCARTLSAELATTTTGLQSDATLLLGSDDPVIAATPDPAAGWRLVLPHLELAVLDGGGHYLNTTRPHELADRVAQQLRT